MGLIGVWNRNVLRLRHAGGHSLRPAARRAFPPISSSLQMESNGKSVQLDGSPAARRPARSSGASPAPTASTPSSSCCIRARKSFPSIFLVAATPTDADAHHHDLLVANCLAQSEALMRGRTPEEAEAHSPASRARAKRRRRGWRRTRSSPAAGRRAPSSIAQLDPAHARPAHRALRAQGVRRRRDLGHQLLRPMGRRTRQGAGLAPRADRLGRGRGHGRSSTRSTAGLVTHLRELRGDGERLT